MACVVKIDKPCSCFFKAELEEQKSFDTLDKAKAYSYEISKFANNSFCKTHFYMPEDEQNDEIMVKVRLRTKKR